MKTYKEWLLELNEKDRIECFLVANPTDLGMLENKERTVGAVFAVAKAQIRNFIHQLRKINAIQSERNVFYAVKMLKDGHEKIGVDLSYS